MCFKVLTRWFNPHTHFEPQTYNVQEKEAAQPLVIQEATKPQWDEIKKNQEFSAAPINGFRTSNTISRREQIDEWMRDFWRRRLLDGR